MEESLREIVKELDSMMPFFKDVISPEVNEFIQRKESLSLLIVDQLGEQHLQTIKDMQQILDTYLGTDHKFLMLLLALLISRRHADIVENEVMSNPSALIGYAVYTATEEYYIDEAHGKQRVKKARKKIQHFERRHYQ